MYFVVYSVKDEEYFIIPKNWIQDLKFERIVNYLLNSSLKYRCYCGSNPAAFVDAVIHAKLFKNFPNGEFIPNFSITDENEFFVASLVKYFGNWCI